MKDTPIVQYHYHPLGPDYLSDLSSSTELCHVGYCSVRSWCNRCHTAVIKTKPVLRTRRQVERRPVEPMTARSH